MDVPSEPHLRTHESKHSCPSSQHDWGEQRELFQHCEVCTMVKMKFREVWPPGGPQGLVNRAVLWNAGTEF